jgi:hypothetical protein
MSDAHRELRRYYRIPSIVPVDFQLQGATNEPLDPEIRTAFTRDLSEAGLCLEVHSLPAALVTRLQDVTTEMRIEVDINLSGRTLRIPGRVAWRRPMTEGKRQGYQLGVQFRDVSAADAAAIAAYARRAARRPRIVRGVLAVLAALLLASAALYLWQGTFYREQLADSHRALAETERQYVNATDRLGDKQMELRWLAVRVREMADMLDEQQGRQTPPAQPTRPAIEELSDNVERLRAALMAGKTIKD